MQIFQPAQSASGRLTTRSKPAHGLDNRGLEAGAIPGMGFGRFGRMFPFSASPIGEACLKDIADAMIKADLSKPIDTPEEVDENPAIPAGYTYFGQFIDHDITLDPTSIKAKDVDVAALEDFRTPALDLDCVYGRGPDDQPYMYTQDQLHLRLGKPLNSGGAAVGTQFDLLRIASEDGAANIALIGDKRNDENRLVAQFQSVFIAFHNKVVDDEAIITAAGGTFSDKESRFRTAVNVVRWHYQWLVVNDFLHRTLSPTIISEILGSGAEPSLPNYQKAKANWAYIPVEFAGAAYRFGHSMIRPGYSLNQTVLTTPPEAFAGAADAEKDARIPIFSDSIDPLQNLNGFGVDIPTDWGIDWSFFLDNVPRAATTPDTFQIPQPSYRLDALLVDPLTRLPEFKDSKTPFNNLAFRNLLRGAANLRLPSGEQIAHALQIKPLPPEILWSAGSRTLDRATLSEEQLGELDEVTEHRQVVFKKWVVSPDAAGRCLAGNTPLWYYILREGEYYGTDRVAEGPTSAFGGQYLGPVGSRIVAETFIGLLWNDPMSYLRRWPGFEPFPQISGGVEHFTLGHLVTWVLSA